MLEGPDLVGKRFLDVGSGSGLQSGRCTTRGYDALLRSEPKSVACARELKARYAADTATWRIEEDPSWMPGTLDLSVSSMWSTAGESSTTLARCGSHSTRAYLSWCRADDSSSGSTIIRGGPA